MEPYTTFIQSYTCGCDSFLKQNKQQIKEYTTKSSEGTSESMWQSCEGINTETQTSLNDFCNKKNQEINLKQKLNLISEELAKLKSDMMELQALKYSLSYLSYFFI